ncbi:DUF3054 domain-containing protein [Gordonia neofelifaecis]|uniref:Transmembrane protein n=1 Tax=Gordonia neofelifaecis NRRL B-59395 TaxID=644548 RepID=F1YKE2_9ACTN|nr:DUF3054 domain-containing protein [Gordonia neofelifaecis]EGD54828.1 hypothetical protein SCNU_11495 [Gordonia neofelifaecis NRRL B-59395]
MSTLAPVASAQRRLALPAVADVVALCVFVAIGRSSHDEAGSLTGFVTTLWPFLCGAIVGWAATAALRRGRSFTPAALWPAGVIVWVSTVVVGMVLRVVSGQGTALSFCIVASIATAVLLLGWRAVAAAVGRRRISAS